MKQISPKQQAGIEAAVTRMQARQAVSAEKLSLTGSVFTPVWNFLAQCEQTLIHFMNGTDPSADKHELEWGLMLHYLNSPHSGLPSWVVAYFRKEGMPPSQITAQMLGQWETTLETTGVLAADGTIIATTKWNALDPDWITTLVYYLYYKVLPDDLATFGTTPQTITLTQKNQLVVGLVSDWGTGPWNDSSPLCPSQAVVKSLKVTPPDVAIHLGDTYYAGTGGEVSSNLVSPFQTGAAMAFALNGNHEMYDGGNGYFTEALANSNTPFTAQKGTSYFALLYGQVAIVGLDTSYYDTSMLYLNGALVDQAQRSFLKSLSSKTVILLTHHNPIDLAGEVQTALWGQVVDALGKQPEYWYWGHLHNGAVYSSTSIAGKTAGRCIGHAALPFGNASVLAGNGNVTYYAKTPYPTTIPAQPEHELRVLNGYAVLTITSSGGITETFYDQDGTERWSTP